jgi:hypothetical protein
VETKYTEAVTVEVLKLNETRARPCRAEDGTTANSICAPTRQLTFACNKAMADRSASVTRYTYSAASGRCVTVPCDHHHYEEAARNFLAAIQLLASAGWLS